VRCLGVSKKFSDCEVLHSSRTGALADYLRNGTEPIVVGAMLCALQTATVPPASALDGWVELTNNTRMTIVEIYISLFGAERWNIDLLSDDFLPPASSVRVNVDDRTGCLFDIKTVFDDGTAQLRRGVNICQMERYTISYR
jgi:hypothetical protein